MFFKQIRATTWQERGIEDSHRSTRPAETQAAGWTAEEEIDSSDAESAARSNPEGAREPEAEAEIIDGLATQDSPEPHASAESQHTADAENADSQDGLRGMELQEVAAQVSSLCTAKAAWARELSLSEPRDLGAELSQLLAGQRMGDVESPAIEEPQELLRKCSGGRALQGCIPTREHWQLQPPRFLMAMPRKVELKVLSWSTDLEARVESLEESSQMKVMAKKFGVSQAQSLEKSSSAGIAGFSKEEKKEQSEERHATDESSRARTGLCSLLSGELGKSG